MASKKAKEVNARTMNFIAGMLVGAGMALIVFSYAFYLGELCTPNGNFPCKPQITNRTSFAKILDQFCSEKLGFGATGTYSPHMTTIGTVGCYQREGEWSRYENFKDFCEYAERHGILC